MSNRKLNRYKRRLAEMEARLLEVSWSRDELRRQLAGMLEIRALEVAQFQARIDALSDPIVRAKMLEPPPPIILHCTDPSHVKSR